MEDGKESMSTCSECLEVLHLILDNEASKEQEEFVNEHIEGCIPCFENLRLEKEIRQLIRDKIDSLPVPEGLANEIRSRLQL